MNIFKIYKINILLIYLKKNTNEININEIILIKN